MINVYATPDRRQIHISFDEREPLPRLPLVLVECFEDSDREKALDLVEMLGDPTGIRRPRRLATKLRPVIGPFH